MKLTEEELKECENLYKEIASKQIVLDMKKVKQHRGSNTFIHSMLVTKKAFQLARRFPKKCHLHSLIRGAMLHDLYLYDWRVQRDKKKGHGHNHPLIATMNAKREFNLNRLEMFIISTHMWPINFKKFPYKYEALLVSLADKIVATKEALTSKKYKAKRLEKTLKKIETLV